MSAKQRSQFYEHHQDSIRFGYRCFDRLLINGLIQPFQQPERVVGFFNTYREQYPVSKAVLTDIATQYQRWVTAQAKAWRTPIVEAPAGRRDAFVEPYFRGATPDQVVVIVKGREPARISMLPSTASDPIPHSPTSCWPRLTARARSIRSTRR